MHYAKYEVFNITCGEEQFIKPIFIPPRPGDVFRTLADISRAKELLGYEPAVGFEEGLRKTVKWFEKQQVLTNYNAGLEGGLKRNLL